MKLFFYSFTVIYNKCGGSCNTIDNPYAGTCIANGVKNMNVKVFNVKSIYETRILVQHELLECKCRLNESVRNSK